MILRDDSASLCRARWKWVDKVAIATIQRGDDDSRHNLNKD